MSQTIKEQELEFAKTKLGNTLVTHLSCYTSVMGLRLLCLQKEPNYKINLTAHPFPMPLEIGNSLSHTFSIMRANSEFLNLKAALDYAEALPEVVLAVQTVQPLVDRVKELEEEVQAERRAASEASNRLIEAVEMARAAAEEKLDRDPAIIAAKKALADAQPALVAERLPDQPLVRGKINNRPPLEIELLAAD